jgi:hypothetical protein
MKYLKTFEELGEYKDINDTKNWMPPTGTNGNVKVKIKSKGEMISDDEEENIVEPISIEITNHKSNPDRKIFTQKLTKNPKVIN